MRIEDLDESQGLTADMVRQWLHKLDPSIKPGASLADDIQAVSDLCGETPQSLLREINPRMRKGMPSGAAIAAHEACGKHWLAKSTQNGGVLRVVILSLSDAAVVPTSWSFWPCDEHGSKVRWPTDSEGKML